MGGFRDWHFAMAGVASTDAVLALVGVFLVLARRTAGWGELTVGYCPFWVFKGDK